MNDNFGNANFISFGNNASGNSININSNNHGQLPNEFEKLILKMQALPKSDVQLSEFEKVKEAAAAVKSNDDSTFKKALSHLGKWTLDVAKEAGIKLIPELMKNI
jgi:hypothetical protein